MGRDFPGGPVVETLPSKTECMGSIPDWGTKIPHASWPTNRNRKQKQYCNKFDKDLKIKKKWADHGFLQRQARATGTNKWRGWDSSLLRPPENSDTRQQNLGPHRR